MASTTSSSNSVEGSGRWRISGSLYTTHTTLVSTSQSDDWSCCTHHLTLTRRVTDFDFLRRLLCNTSVRTHIEATHHPKAPSRRPCSPSEASSAVFLFRLTRSMRSIAAVGESMCVYAKNTEQQQRRRLSSCSMRRQRICIRYTCARMGHSATQQVSHIRRGNTRVT